MKKNNKLNKAVYSLAGSLLFLTGVLLFNLLIDKNNRQWDMTDKKIFSLSSQSDELLKGLDESIKIYALYKRGDEAPQIMGILEQYAAYPKIKLQTIDPDRNPALLTPFAKAGEDLSPGTIILQKGKTWKILRDSDLYIVDYTDETSPQVYGLKAEQMLSSAIIYVKNGRTPLICEISGHEERLIGATDIGKALEEANFELTEGNIINQGGIPSETDIVMITGPQHDFTEYEIEKLNDFLIEGGRLFLSLGYASEAMPNLTSLLASFNIRIENGLVMETDGNRQLPEFGDNPFFFIPGLKDDKIGDFVRTSQQTPFFAASIAFTRTPAAKKNLEYTPFLTTSAQSFLRYDLSRSETTMVESDRKGPLDVGVLIAEKDRESGLEQGVRIAVIGSSTALSGMGGIGVFPGNIKLLTGAMQWLDNHETVFVTPGKSLLASRIDMDTQTALVCAIVFSLIIPLLIFMTGFIIRRRRKHL